MVNVTSFKDFYVANNSVINLDLLYVQVMREINNSLASFLWLVVAFCVFEIMYAFYLEVWIYEQYGELPIKVMVYVRSGVALAIGAFAFYLATLL